MPHSYYGYIFSANAEALDRKIGVGGGSILRKGVVEYAAGDWVKFDFLSDSPLHRLEPGGGPPYVYSIIACQRSEFSVIAADERSVVDVLVEGLWKGAGLRRIGVNVHSLVMDTIDKKFKIHEGTGAKLIPCITFLNAKTNGYSPRVEWVTFQGQDLSVAKMVTEHRGKVVFNRCGLRVPGERTERARFAFDGSVDFPEKALHEGATLRGGSHLEELILSLIEEGYTR